MNQKHVSDRVYEMLIKRRSIRRFSQKTILQSILTQCVDVGRLAPSGANLQPLFLLLSMRVISVNSCLKLLDGLRI